MGVEGTVGHALILNSDWVEIEGGGEDVMEEVTPKLSMEEM